MNLPCIEANMEQGQFERLAYKIGHRDARHAAAEIAQEVHAALLARLDAAEADAKRYRFLRDVAWGDGSLLYFDQRYDNEEWDAKIDAALSSAGGV